MDQDLMQEDIHTAKKSGAFSWGIVTLLLVVGGYLLYSQNQASLVAPVTPVENTSNSTLATSTLTDTSVKEFNLVAGSFFYEPKVLEVKKGDKVKIILTTNDEMKMHDFTLDELNIHSERAKKDQPVTIEFTADKAGDFEFYCSVMDHRAKGQVGTLKVTE